MVLKSKKNSKLIVVLECIYASDFSNNPNNLAFKIIVDGKL